MALVSNNVRQNGSPPQTSSPREIAPGRPLSGIIAEVRRRDWDKPTVDIAAVVEYVAGGFTGIVPAGAALIVQRGVVIGYQ